MGRHGKGYGKKEEVSLFLCHYLQYLKPWDSKYSITAGDLAADGLVIIV